MKLTRIQLKKIIQEAMYDPRTLPSDRIPKSMIAIGDKDFKEKLSFISGDEKGYSQAKDLIDSLGGKPAVIDIAGGYRGYQGVLKKADHMNTLALFNDIKYFIHNIYPSLPKLQKPYHDLIKLQYSRGTLMTQDDIIDTILNISPESFFEGMWYYYLTDRGHEDPTYDDLVGWSDNYKKHDNYLKFIEQELRKFYTADRIEKIATGVLL